VSFGPAWRGPVLTGRRPSRSSPLSEPYRRKPPKGGRPSAAALGVVKVDPDFNVEFPDGDASSTEAFATLARVGAACMQELERFVGAHFEMPMAAATVLAVLDGAVEPITPSQISERVLVASATMTATLDLLERRDWVRRTPNPDDRRSTLVEITADGRATADRLLPGIRAIERGALSPLTGAERVQLMDLLAQVLDRLATIAAEPPQPLAGTRIRPARLSGSAT
jgi:DNA-binding MarR family transcriptional regulator